MREYPSAPLVGVGAIIVDRGRILLVERGRAPARGKWSIPGGLVEVGEPAETAVRREVREECGLEVRVRGLVGFVDRIVRDDAGHVRYHYVLLDFLATTAEGSATPGSDARALRWVAPEELASVDVTEGLDSMIRRALAMDLQRVEREGTT